MPYNSVLGPDFIKKQVWGCALWPLVGLQSRADASAAVVTHYWQPGAAVDAYARHVLHSTLQIQDRQMLILVALQVVEFEMSKLQKSKKSPLNW